jgi:hypothetical protein
LTKTTAFVEALSHKLVHQQVLFFTGAGLSYNWGIKLGGQVAEVMLNDFMVNVLGMEGRDRTPGNPKPLAHPLAPVNIEMRRWIEELAPWTEKNPVLRPSDLPLVAELVGQQNKCFFVRRYIVSDVGDASGPPPLAPSLVNLTRRNPVHAQRIGVPHLAIGRLAKEGLVTELMTANIDCLHEAGCEAVGMCRIDEGEPKDEQALRFPWTDAYRVVHDGHNHAALLPSRNLFTIHKIHGCVDVARKTVSEQQAHNCNWYEATHTCETLSQERFNMVFTYRELLNWRRDNWARDLFADRVRNHHVVFTGFAVADAVSHATFREVFEEVLPPSARVEQHQGTSPSVTLVAASSEQPFGSTSGDIPITSLRAQVISKGLNPQGRSALLAANQFDPLLSNRQFANGSTREDLDRLFRQIYESTIREALEGTINLHARGLIAQQSPDTDVEQLASDLLTFLKSDSLPMEFLWSSLPNALRLSWLAGSHLLTSRRKPVQDRFRSDTYYVPLTAVPELTIPLLRANQVLIQAGQASVDGSGWIRLFTNGRRRITTLLPLVAPVPPNLAELAQTRRLSPPPGGVAKLLLIGNAPSVASAASIGAFGGASQLLSNAVTITWEQLWSPKIEEIILTGASGDEKS